MTQEQERNLAFVVGHNGIRIFSPTQRSWERYGPLMQAGWVTIRDIGRDEQQETILSVDPTDAGREALRNYDPKRIDGSSPKPDSK